VADLSVIHLALRARAEALVVVTTGSMALAATTTGFTRSSGSFITDGFAIGMEVTPSGFAINDPATITRVTATALTVSRVVAAEGANTGRTLTVGFPALRARENVIFQPIDGRPWVEEEFIPAGGTLTAGPYANGVREETGLYVVRWYGIANTGALGLRRAIDALAARFACGTAMVAGSNVVRVRGDVAPFASRIAPRDDSWAVCSLTIPWRCYSTNVIVT
jgi:hypothetical protein